MIGRGTNRKLPRLALHSRKLPFTLVTVGKKITTQPTRCIHISFRGKDREACFTSTIQFILRRGYSSNSVYRGKCNGVKPWNNLQFREARTTRKYKGLFNNAAVLYLTNPCNVYIFLNTHIFLFLDKNLKINLNRVFVRELKDSIDFKSMDQKKIFFIADFFILIFFTCKFLCHRYPHNLLIVPQLIYDC